MAKSYLLTPGPTQIPLEVAFKEAMPVIHHRTNEFGLIYKNVVSKLKCIFKTKNDVYILSTSGTGAMEAAIVNLLSFGDEIIVASCGIFGKRWVEIAKEYGIKIIHICVELGKIIKPYEIEKILNNNVNVKAVYTTFVETSTCVVNDIMSIGKIVSKTKAIFVVDAISGLVGQEFKTDEWNVDVVVSSSQKGFMVAPGLAFITFSNKAWELVKNSKLPKFYLDIKKYKKSYFTNGTPFTPSITLISSLDESLKLIHNKGLENIWNDCRLFAKAVRAGMLAIGLNPFGEKPCDVVTAAIIPCKIGVKITKILKEKYNVSIADGHGDLKGKIIRFAHMGYIGITDLLVGFACLEMALTELGMKIEKGKSVATIEEMLLPIKNKFIERV
ncbi:MAG: alanine--glyoxylate aminotransferase family protein [Endomicrobium sp.]|jgi:aspartate aminotransferase-like enzyme|nr:alanine--glyoxylate aminotransferase family protein [Endomicrobium sp.]